MCIMTITRNGETREILASGWTEGETLTARRAYEADGWAVSFRYGVWR